MGKANKNNPSNRNKGTQEKFVLTKNNFYGFNSALWMSVKAEDELEAEKLIRAANKLPKGTPLTIKPYNV